MITLGLVVLIVLGVKIATLASINMVSVCARAFRGFDTLTDQADPCLAVLRERAPR